MKRIIYISQTTLLLGALVFAALIIISMMLRDVDLLVIGALGTTGCLACLAMSEGIH